MSWLPRRPVRASGAPPWALRRHPPTPVSILVLLSFAFGLHRSHLGTHGGGAQVVGQRPPELHIARDRANRRRPVLHRAGVVAHRAVRWASTTVERPEVGEEEQLQSSELRLVRTGRRLLCHTRRMLRAQATLGELRRLLLARDAR